MAAMAYRPNTGSELRHNTKCIIFPDGSREYLWCDKPIFGLSGWEESNKWDTCKSTRRKRERGDSSPDATDRAQRRAKARVHVLAMANEFDWFVTLTLSSDKIDRYDMDAITRKLNVWLDNQVRRKGLRYVLVPERHKDGAIHFHGFFNDALPATDSGHTDRAGHPIFNLPGWTLGFSTAIRLYGSYRSAVGYVCKYIGKQGEKPGGRWYYSGGDLKEPVYKFVDMFRDDLPADAYTFRVDDAGMAMAKWTEGGDDDALFSGIEEEA